jgi:hypothetical protein
VPSVVEHGGRVAVRVSVVKLVVVVAGVRVLEWGGGGVLM